MRPFPLNYPAAQADGAVKSVYGTGTAVFAVRIRSALDGAGGDVLDTLIVERWYLGKREQQLPSACGLPPRRSCGTGKKNNRPRSCNTWSENTRVNWLKAREYKPLRAFLFCSEMALSEQTVTN